MLKSKKFGCLRFLNERRKESKKYVIAKDLPYLALKPYLKMHFRYFGKVKRMDLIHKNGNYSRSALVKMGSLKSIKKINAKTHLLNRTRINIESFHGMKKHLEGVVEGAFHVELLNVFTPPPPVPDPIPQDYDHGPEDALAERAYKRLERVFHEFKYAQIRILHEGTRFYTGNATIIFADDKDRDAIISKARDKFRGCLVVGWSPSVI